MRGYKVIAKAESYGGISEPTHFLCRELAELDRREHQRNAFFNFVPDEIKDARHTLDEARLQPPHDTRE